MGELIKLLALILGTLAFTSFVQAECGYESCHAIKSDQVNIHLVPHSHDDLGWLKTYEQYYYGSHNDIYSAGVQYILSSVLEALRANADRRFIYVETGFFWKWWISQNEKTQNEFRELVENGQLEFISGGWSMNDEGSTYYQTIIDQMTWGLRRLNDSFGECGRPKVAWQIDTFGHSREMASIFSQLGFDGFFLNRIDYQDHETREKNKSLEFVWRGSPDNLGESSDIFTGVLFRHYSAPGGLCFDFLCNDEPIIDDPDSPEYNINQKAETFVNDWIKPALNAYTSNNLLVPMGDDFQYQNAIRNYINIDKLISYMNGRDFDGVKYNVIYSTPSCYLNAVHQSTNGILDTVLKTDDFLPYASANKTYWTGYFTSRPTGKGYGRFSNNFLQVCKQLSAITNTTTADESAKLNVLREALGVFQHHDAITGTELEDVAPDYYRLLHLGISKCEEVTNQALSKLVNVEDTTFTTCHLLNISQCATTEKENELIITLYNPLGRSVDKYVRIPVVDNSSDYAVTDPSGNRIVTQLLPIHKSVLTTPGRNSSAQYDLVFKAENIPPLGYKSFYYQRNAGSRSNPAHPEYQYQSYPGMEIKTKSSKETELVMQTEDGLKLTVNVSYLYYTGAVGDGSAPEHTSSNNHIFRPDPDIPVQAIPASSDPMVQYTGPLITETHVYYNDWFSYITRTFNDSNIVELNYLVGPLPFGDQGVEVIARFNTDLKYDDKIYTDTNGREIIDRIRNYRASWDVQITEPESGNYYPIVTGVLLQNETAGIAILNDRSQGGGSMDYQYVELMIHRNTKACCLRDEAFGTGVVSRGSHYIVYTGTDFSTSESLNHKEISQQIYLDSWIFFSNPNGQSFDEYQKTHVMEFSGLKENALPRNVHLLTLEPWDLSTVLVRLENFIGQEDQFGLSGSSTVDLQELFAAFKVESIRETTLGGNQWLEENSRIFFNKNSDEAHKPIKQEGFNITLEPMQIRTFVVSVSY